MADIMLDMETLAVTPDAVILTFGAVKFDPYNADKEPNNPLYLRLNVDEQTAANRFIDQGTLDWWAKQSAEVQEEAMGDDNRISLEEFTIQLNRYIVGADKIWSNGICFDITIIENLYRMLGKPIPWKYSIIRDARTIYDLGDDSAKKNNSSAHNALADAYVQAKAVQSIFAELGVTKKSF